MKVGRNDPCPCGSGKKYKRCCLLKQRPAAPSAIRRAMNRAIEWLDKRYPEDMIDLLGFSYLGSLGDELEEIFEAFESLPEDLRQTVLNNGWEWILAEGELVLDGEKKERRVVDLVLGPGGPLLAAEERTALEELARRPLRLYEVDETVPGEGLWLRDITEERGERVWVVERMGSQQTVRGDLLAARLVPLGEALQASVVYSYPRIHRANLVERLRAEAGVSASDDFLDREHWVRQRISTVLVDFWLELACGPRNLPQVVDVATGEPIVFVIDRYQVSDWDALAAALAAQPDVEGDRDEGWMRFVELEEEETRRLLLDLKPGRGERLAVSARTLAHADDARRWLEEIAGGALTFHSRELNDPLTAARDEEGDRPPDEPEIPMTREMMEQVYHRQYRGWADEPIPALGDETPRQAMKTAKGRKQVVALLEDYENNELHMADAQGREPASLEFLWQELGLERPAERP